MSRSWLQGAPLLHENAYGSHAAIHGFYLVLAFAPLTLWLGAYGLFVGLALLQLLAALRVALTPALDGPGRLAVLFAGLLSPLAWYVLDDVGYGFHPELCYPPLAVLLALALLERRLTAAVVAGAALVLVKEDGALVCAGVLAAYHACRLWRARGGPADERQRRWRAAAWSVGAAVLAFGFAMLLLWWAGHGAPPVQETASPRVGRALGILWRTLAQGGPEGRQAALLDLLGAYAALALLPLLPLARRLGTGIALVALAAPPVLAVLVVSDAQYKFTTLLWAPRAATLLAVVLGSVVALAGGAGDEAETRPRPSPSAVTLLVLLSWAGQLALLGHVGYTRAGRLDLPALWQARGSALASLPQPQAAFWRCLGRQLPRGLPVSPAAELYPFFHQQSIVFQTLEAHAREPARLRIASADEAGAGPLATVPCATALLGPYRIAMTCDVEPVVAGCSAAGSAPLIELRRP